MRSPHTLILLFVLSVFPSGCSKNSQVTNANVASSSSPLTLGDKARLIEAKMVNGESIAESEIQELSPTELRILRNACFARHGRKYDSPGLGDYFSTCSWYKAREDYNDNVLTPSDRDNVRLILAAEQRANQTSNNQTASNANSSGAQTQPPVPPAPPAPKMEIGFGQPTTDKVQRAVDKALDWTRKGGRAMVLGIQEIPHENAAKADLRFDGFQYNANSYDMPIPRDQRTPPEPDIRDPNWGQKMYQNRAGQVHVDSYSGQGTAVLKHYSDGRWVLTGVQFGLHGVNADIEVK